MRPNPTRAWGPDPHSCPPAPPTLVHSALDDQALLGLMLRRAVQGPHGDPGKNTHRLAGALLERFSGLGAVVAAEPGELARAPGLDPVALSDLKLLRELAIRLARGGAGAALCRAAQISRQVSHSGPEASSRWWRPLRC